MVDKNTVLKFYLVDTSILFDREGILYKTFKETNVKANQNNWVLKLLFNIIIINIILKKKL